jgi:hypothetical protein
MVPLDWHFRYRPPAAFARPPLAASESVRIILS